MANPFNLPIGVITNGPYSRERNCWICGNQDALHNHHCIPRNAGGNDGPQVVLCNNCHEAIHLCANQFYTAKLYSRRTDAKQHWIGGEQFVRADYLIGIIQASEEAVADNPNKTTVMNLTLTGEEDRMLTFASKRLKLSKPNTLKLAIRNLSKILN